MPYEINTCKYTIVNFSKQHKTVITQSRNDQGMQIARILQNSVHGLSFLANERILKTEEM
jgi:hypothetical protein